MSRILIILLMIALLINCTKADKDLKNRMNIFTSSNVIDFSQLLIDVPREQIIVGARDHLFRLSLMSLRPLELNHWTAPQSTINICLRKGRPEEDCHNFIRVLVMQGTRIFTCGTNAFAPVCAWRDVSFLNITQGLEDGDGKCPYSPHTNSTAVLTSEGDYYVASALDFSSEIYAIYRSMGKEQNLITVYNDPTWLNEPNFVASYEIGNFIYFFFREVAVEHINCGKVIYSRVGRVCKNDQGGQYILKDNWTTFLKSRLSCSVPGPYPFYYNEIQSIYLSESQEIMYAAFTTPENSIYGSAICAFNMSTIHQVFNGPLKYQSSRNATWEKQTVSHNHFQCQTPGGDTQTHLDADKYHLTHNAVSSVHGRPVYTSELERLGPIAVDIVYSKHHEEIHVIYVATIEGELRKIVTVPKTSAICLVEKLQILPEGQPKKIKIMKLLKDFNSLYIGTEDSVLRVPLHRCGRFKSKDDCLNSYDPYCGWSDYNITPACTTADFPNEIGISWDQKPFNCPNVNAPVDGGWGEWSEWKSCSYLKQDSSIDECMCQQRVCVNPKPAFGGNQCEGISTQVTNCTGRLAQKRSLVHGHWSEWSSWSECNSFCGGGIQTRERKCDDPAPQQGGNYCLGCHRDFRICNSHKCPEHKTFSPWTPWILVNTTKDGYFQQRFRAICKANIPNVDYLKDGHLKKQERFCLNDNLTCLDSGKRSPSSVAQGPETSSGDNVNGDWAEWSVWAPCSVSCGTGVQYRQRTCGNPPLFGNSANCQGPFHEEKLCHLPVCNVSTWTGWTDWSSCSVSCGSGIRIREKVCDNPDDCKHWNREEKLCHLPDCDDGWGEWTAWSSCDSINNQQRQRRCKYDRLSLKHCSGESKETRACGNCPKPKKKYCHRLSKLTGCCVPGDCVRGQVCCIEPCGNKCRDPTATNYGTEFTGGSCKLGFPDD